MKLKMAWLLTIAVALVLPSLVWNYSLHAASQNREAGVENSAVPEAPYNDGFFSAGNRHKFEITDRKLAAELQKRGGRVVADYSSSLLVEVDTAAAKSLIKNKAAQLKDEYNVIMLNAGPIDTTLPEAAELQSASLSEAGTGRRMHLVQFAGPIKPEWYDALANTGVDIVTYIPSNSYLVYGDAASIRAVKRLARQGHVQWDGEYKDAYRVDPAIYARAKEQSINPQAKEGQGDLYAIQLFNDPKENARTFRLIDLYKTEPIASQWGILRYINIFVKLSPDALKEIASRPDVVSIQPEVVPTKNDERQNQIIAGNFSGNPAVPTPGDWLAYLAGKGFDVNAVSSFGVEIADSGVDNATTTPNHFGLFLSGVRPGTSRVAFNRLEGSPNSMSTLQGCDGHGTINAHIIGGFVPFATNSGLPHADASGFRFGMGVAPFVRVGSSVIFDPNLFTNPDHNNQLSRAYADGMRISSNSWGANVAGAYNTRSQAYDALTRDSQSASSVNPTAGNQEMVIVFAAGNSGSGAQTVGAPASAKNVITAGASENVHAFGAADQCNIADTGANNAMDIISFSSRGPTADGRKKPDIMAPGTHVTGGVFQAAAPGANGQADACFTAGGVCAGPGANNFFPTGQEWYTASSGTSHSCPAIAGAAALVRQHFINLGQPVPSPALTKALLMNTAGYMTGTGANDNLWSNSQGMGLLNLENYFAALASPNIIRDQVVADTFTASGQARSITGNVADTTEGFRVTLAWTDPPGPTSGNAFINNLDLEVTVGGQSFKGNVFTGANSVTGGTADTRNNVESVFVPASVLQAGANVPFVVTVRAINIAGDGVPGNATALDQDYALAIINANQVAQAVIASAGATIVSESCTPANGAIDPNETVTVSLCLQNVGTTDTSNLVATLAASGGVTSPSGPQNYGALVAGGAAVCRNFTFTASGACGSTLTATLNLQDGATSLGTVTFNFTLGTLNTAFTENFDGVTAPALPAGWTAQAVIGAACGSGTSRPWDTATTPVDTAPNAATAPDPNCVNDIRLDSPAINISTASAVLNFRNNFNVENGFDGGVLEISIGGGAFQDIIAAGGSFVAGGYNRTISVNFSSPIAGRQAWSGNSGGYITTTINLPAAAAGQSIVLRFRMATDSSVSGSGWRVDTISLTDGFVCCSASGTPCGENFDSVTAPALPAGWTAATAIDCATSNPWETSSAGNPAPAADSAPNSAFVNDPNCISDERLDSPSFPVTSASATLTFRNNFNMENGFDGGVLEISIGGGAFQDIIAAGGSFVAGGYNGTISVNFGSPIAGRQAWTGNSGGFITTTVNLPASANGQGVVFRFRRGTDSSVTGQGWRIDTLTTTGTNCGADPCTITCPANITVSNDPNQCGAVVNYPAPTTTGTCGTVTCSPASGSFFPTGTTTVTCSTTAGPSCDFTITVVDTQSPSITCPANVTAVTPVVGGSGAVVTYPPPTASDNCPGVTTVCTPPSGTTFPVGTTTVTCTATDASGNTATCTFTVTVFNICIQDDTNPGSVLLINSFTGDYLLCCAGTTFTGRGTMSVRGNTYTLTHNTADRRLTARADGTTDGASASFQAPPGKTICTLSDRAMRDNACACGGTPPSSK